jgi:hypothetical protein
MSGYTIVYNTDARVCHYHFETPDFAFRRYFTISYHFYQIFGSRPSLINDLYVRLLQNLKLLLMEKDVRFKDKYKWLLYNFRRYKAVNRAVKIFNKALSSGADELEKVHAEICGATPQALKPLVYYDQYADGECAHDSL